MNILVIEPECKGWNHEQVNFEFLNMLSKYFREDNIFFCGERKQLDNIRRCEKISNVEYQEIELPHNAGDTMKYWKYYRELFKNILLQREYQKVILLSSHKGNILAIKCLAEQYPDIQFVITLHAVVEQLCRHYTMRDRLLDDKFFHGWKLKQLIEMAVRKENIKFVTYSPSLSEKLKSCMEKEALEKIYFLHHPYHFIENPQMRSHTCLTIGLLGATANNNAEKIIQLVEEKCSEEQYKFKLLRASKRFEAYKHVEMINNGEILDRETISEEMQTIDYLMIPYDSTMYGLSASGVFFDAINYEIPMLMLDSPLLIWYDERYHLGVRKDSCELLAESIIEIIRKNTDLKREKYCENMKRAKIVLQQENEALLKRILE